MATELIDRIKMVDQLLSTSPSENLYTERNLFQTEFDSRTNDNPIDLHLKSSHKFYKHQECATKLLCYQLKQSATAAFMSEIKDRKAILLRTKET